MARKESYLRKIYFDPRHPGGFASADKLYKTVQREGKFKVSQADVRRWLASVDSYTMNRPVVRRLDNRRRTKNKLPIHHLFEQWDADLMDMRADAKANDGYAYILVVIDVFSRYLWTRPLKTKTLTEVKEAFEDILSKAGQTPQRLRTDGGREFTGRIMKEVYKDLNIYHYVAHNESKATFAERVIQTLKRMMFRYMVHKNELRWIDVLPDITQNYNATYHSVLRMAPDQVSSSNQDQVWANQVLLPIVKQMKTSSIKKEEKKQMKKPKKVRYKVKVGDYVRISFKRQPFERVYDQKYSGEIFQVAKCYT